MSDSDSTIEMILPEPVRSRRLRDSFEPIAMHNTRARPRRRVRLGTRLPMDEPTAAVVAAFGVFEPELIAAAYERGRKGVGRQALLTPQVDASAAITALRRGIEAAHGTGRALFSGLLSLPWPEDPAAQLWRARNLLREHRGDSHLAASISAGLDPVEMNILTELWLGIPLGPYTATRGWSEPRTAVTATELAQRGLIASGAFDSRG